MHLRGMEKLKMSEVKVVENRLLDEKYYEINHKSGLKILVYPKEKYNSTFAVFGTHYGSIDTVFKTENDNNFTEVPEGIAHFLEHKLFESEELDAFERFSKTGASANAYTSFDRTCYLFSCSGNPYPSLEILLDFVMHPYFTEQTVQKEQGIIGQEIRMYRDEPIWEVEFGMLRSMYSVNPVRIDIAGTEQSISDITADLLYKCYNTFYNYDNMVLCLAGNVKLEKVIETVDKILPEKEQIKIQRKFFEEPDKVVNTKYEKHLPVSIPLFCIGFKQNVKTPERSLKEVFSEEIMLSCIFGKTTEFYERLMDEGLINDSFSTGYFSGYGYACHLINGESKNPEKVFEKIKEEIIRIKKIGISEDCFKRNIKAALGGAVRSYNEVETLANAMVSAEFSGGNIFSQLDILKELTVENINNSLNENLNLENTVISIIR